MAVVTPLYNHTSPETAYLVEDYPYGRSVRCRIRYWLETKGGKGVRFCSQTEHPTRKVWNKPKCSTYAKIAGCMYLDEKSYVQWDCLTEYSDTEKVAQFLTSFPLAPRLISIAYVFDKCRMMKAFAENRAGWSINGGPIVNSDADLVRYAKEYAEWESVSKQLASMSPT